MRKVVCVSILAALVVARPLTARAEASLSGEINDEDTGQPLIGATIRSRGYLAGGLHGHERSVPVAHSASGCLQVEVSQIGYSTFTDTVRVAPEEKARLVVRPDPQPLPHGRNADSRRTSLLGGLLAGRASVRSAHPPQSARPIRCCS